MKKVISLFVFILIFSTITNAQRTYNLDSTSTKAPATKESLIKGAIKTTSVAIYHGENHVVYGTKAGKIFIPIQSKNGIWYRKYIKKD